MKDNVHTLILFPKKVAKTRREEKEAQAEGKKLEKHFLYPMGLILEETEKFDKSKDPDKEEKKATFIKRMRAYFIEAAEKFNEKTIYWEVNPFSFRNIFEREKSDKHELN